MSFLAFSKRSLMFCCAKESVNQSLRHMSVALPLIKRVFGFIISLIFSVFFFGFDFRCLNRSE